MIKKSFKPVSKNAAVTVWLAVLAYIIIFSVIGIWKYNNFFYNSLDMAIFNQTFFNTSQGNLFGLTIHPPTYLNDHFTPLLLVLSVFYSWFGSPIFLIIIQNCALGAAAFLIFLISKEILRNTNWALFLSIAFLFNPFIQNLSLFEFHMLPFALPLIFTAFYFYKKNRFGLFLLMSAFSLLAREDVALVIFMFGIISVIDKKNKKWIFSPIILSVLYFILAMSVINYFSADGGYKFEIYYSWLGNSIWEIMLNIIKKPYLMLFKITNLSNLEMILGLLLPFAFLPLARAKYLLLALPIFLQISLGAPGGSALILNTQYSTLFLPGLFIAFIYGVKKFIDGDFKNKIYQIFQKEKKLSLAILATAIVYGGLALGPLVGTIKKIALYDYSRTKIFERITEPIPKEMPVVASYNMLANLSSRPKIYALNYFFIGKQQFGYSDYDLPADTEYMAIDFNDFLIFETAYKNNDLYRENFDSGGDRIRKKIEDGGFGIELAINNAALFKKGHQSNIFLYEELETLPDMEFKQEMVFNDKIKLLGYEKQIMSEKIFLTLYWQTKKNIKDNYFLNIYLSGQNTNRPFLSLPLGYGIYPVKNWPTKKIIKTNYWLAFLENEKKSPEIALEIFKINEGGIFVDYDRSTKLKLTDTQTIGHKIFLTN